MLKIVIFVSMLCFYYVSSVEAISGYTIASKADSYVGSTKWSFASMYLPLSFGNSNKCNLFIYDVMKAVGGNVPHRYWFMDSPIGAGEWGNSSSSFLTEDRCWKNVNSPQVGDVMAEGGHVAFYTGTRKTTSAARYEVVKNDWGFRSGSGFGTTSRSYTYWRYDC